MLLPQFPQEVDRVILALLAEEEVDVAYDGEGKAGGGQPDGERGARWGGAGEPILRGDAENDDYGSDE